MRGTIAVTIALALLVVERAKGEPSIAADGNNIEISAESVAITQSDGQSITSAELIQLRSDLADAQAQIAGLTSMMALLSGNVSSQTASFQSQLSSVDEKLDKTSNNLIHGSDFGDVSTWRNAQDLTTVRALFQNGGFGDAPVTVHQVVETVHSPNDDVCYGAFPQTNMISVSPLATYNLEIWIKSNTTELRNYFGFYAFDSDMRQIGGEWQNPYFRSRTGDVNLWHQHTAILRPADTDTNTRHSSVETTSPWDWKLPVNARYVTVRWGSCYGDGDGTAATWFAFPKMTLAAPEPRKLISDHSRGQNLIEFSDYSNLDTWVEPSFEIERTAWNDGSMIRASVWTETQHSPDQRVCYGRFAQTNYITIDPMLKYDFGIWIKSNSTDMNNYVGYFLFDSEFNQIGDSWINPYFRWDEGDKPYFVYHSARIWPADTSERAATSADLDVSARTDWRFPRNASYLVMRWGSCYGDGSGDGASWFAYPEVKQSFQSKLEGHAVMSPARAVRSVGRWNVVIQDNFRRRLGTSGQNPSPWVELTPGNNNGGIGFSFGDYTQELARDGTQELVYRACVVYTDTAAGQSTGTAFRIRRISERQDGYGSARGYPAGHVFWNQTFPRTWSGAALFHHDCGVWLPAEGLVCGYSWSDTCQIDVLTTVGGDVVDVREFDLEIGVRRRI